MIVKVIEQFQNLFCFICENFLSIFLFPLILLWTQNRIISLVHVQNIFWICIRQNKVKVVHLCSERVLQCTRPRWRLVGAGCRDQWVRATTRLRLLCGGKPSLACATALLSRRRRSPACQATALLQSHCACRIPASWTRLQQVQVCRGVAQH